MFKNIALFWMVEFKIQCDFRWSQSLTPEFWLLSGSRDEPHTLKTQPERLKSAGWQPGLYSLLNELFSFRVNCTIDLRVTLT